MNLKGSKEGCVWQGLAGEKEGGNDIIPKTKRKFKKKNTESPERCWGGGSVGKVLSTHA